MARIVLRAQGLSSCVNTVHQGYSSYLLLMLGVNTMTSSDAAIYHICVQNVLGGAIHNIPAVKWPPKVQCGTVGKW